MADSNFIYKIQQAPVHGAGAGGDAAESALQAVITGLLQERRHVEVPETIEGIPVAAIAPHAFADQAHVRSISLPQTLRSVGAFAFHNCPELEEISLHDSIHDFHNGVVRQDRRLRRIRLTVHEGNYTVMRDILSDTDAKLQFSLRLPDGEARLLFPGYDYAFNENTMARTIQFSISGSGMVYRECVRRKGIGFREYDRLFARVIPDDPNAAAEIAADRLLFPYDLAGVHREAYVKYLKENAAEALRHFVLQLQAGAGAEASDEAYMRLQLMAERGMISAGAADKALGLASGMHLTKACSIIISGREAAISLDQTGTALSLWEEEEPLVPEPDHPQDQVSAQAEIPGQEEIPGHEDYPSQTDLPGREAVFLPEEGDEDRNISQADPGACYETGRGAPAKPYAGRDFLTLEDW